MKAPNKIEITTWIKNGKFNTNLDMIKDFCNAWDNCLIHITFHKKSNSKSNKQLGYYFSVIVAIMQNCIKEEWQEIWTKQETHEFLLSNFNYEELVNEETGQILRKVRRSSANNTKEQEAYHQKCRQFILEYFNVVVPLPEKQVKITFE
jgi:hypothetical protein